MQTKPLLYGLIGFILGGLLVSIAAVTFEKQADTSMRSMASSLDGKTGDDFDREFIGQMIIHHQGAIDMANKAALQAKHQEVKGLSKNIIDAQQSEIVQMKQWQSRWGYDTSSTTHDTMH